MRLDWENMIPWGSTLDHGVIAGVGQNYRSRENMPATIGPSTVLWYRIICDGSSLTVLCQDGVTEPGTWSLANHRVYESDEFDFTGGQLGFIAKSLDHDLALDDVTLRTDRDADGTYETVEHMDDFTVDANGYADITPTHDAAGNLTYDGLYAYEYDAWNHLVKTSRAYRDPDTGPLAVGSIVQTARHDGLGRRIVKAVRNSADLNCTYHYYYDGQSVVEERDGSDLTIKQHVWGNLAGGYIDELVQTAINENPLTDSTCETLYYAATGSNYNVLGLFDASGNIAERYEYTPYGQRQVYTSSGTNDPAAHKQAGHRCLRQLTTLRPQHHRPPRPVPRGNHRTHLQPRKNAQPQAREVPAERLDGICGWGEFV